MGAEISLILDGLILVFLCVTIFYAARMSLFMKTFREGRQDMNRLIADLNRSVDKAESSIRVMKDNALNTEKELRVIIGQAKFLSDELKFMNETGDSLADRLEKLADRNRELVDLMEKSGGIGTQRFAPSVDLTKVITKEIPPREMQKPEVQKLNAPVTASEEDDFEFEFFDDEEIEEDDERDFQMLSDGSYRSNPSFLQKESHKSAVNTEAISKVRSFAIFDRDYEGQDLEEANEESSIPSLSSDERKFHSRAEQELYEALQRKKNSYDENKLPQKSVNKIS